MSPQNTLASVQESTTMLTITSEDATELHHENEEVVPYKRKKRKKTSDVWLNFKEVILSNGDKKSQCIHCKIRLQRNQSGSTTHLKRHSEICTGKKVNQTAKGQQTLTITNTISQLDKVTFVQNFKYDQAKIGEVLSHIIIVHELPFSFYEYELFNLWMIITTPHYEKINRATTRNDCVMSFELEKKMMKLELKEVVETRVARDFFARNDKLMNVKFDKYWRSCNLLLCVAAVLDPKNKMEVVKWCAENTCSEVDGVVLMTIVREALRALTMRSQPKSRALLESYMSDDESVTDNSELDSYLDEPVVKWKESYLDEHVVKWKEKTFDVIVWWKMNSSNAGGRVIDPHRASFGVDTVQMLLCTGDWLRGRYGIKGKARDKESSIKEVNVT
ncbi:hypothetical protein C2S53_009721 [Perilla frutescens var. hirtella]|uniref:BED-type domain-containing protein n=1 Tax=Perilla frutescens var. hirtella TaxID=608512 RepID=A0AAD4NZK2_PERFH|nr:hypothetical protein C2S53_009721 [Perilla frutescens var. hirtella]